MKFYAAIEPSFRSCVYCFERNTYDLSHSNREARSMHVKDFLPTNQLRKRSFLFVPVSSGSVGSKMTIPCALGYLEVVSSKASALINL